jgi:hypothetical protein
VKDTVGLTPLELAQDLLSRIERGHAYARDRRRRFRHRSVAVRLVSLALSGASTIILGLQNLDFWASLGFALVALVTVVNGLEPFFAWRSLWVLMEETQHRFHRLEDDVTFYLAATPADQVDPARIEEMFERYQQIWDQQGDRWLEFRRSTSSDP